MSQLDDVETPRPYVVEEMGGCFSCKSHQPTGPACIYCYCPCMKGVHLNIPLGSARRGCSHHRLDPERYRQWRKENGA